MDRHITLNSDHTQNSSSFQTLLKNPIVKLKTSVQWWHSVNLKCPSMHCGRKYQSPSPWNCCINKTVPNQPHRSYSLQSPKRKRKNHLQKTNERATIPTTAVTGTFAPTTLHWLQSIQQKIVKKMVKFENNALNNTLLYRKARTCKK